MELKWNKDLPVEYWIAAARFSAIYVGYSDFSEDENQELTFHVWCNDVFVPAADSYSVEPEGIYELLDLARNDISKNQYDNIMLWIANKIGFSDKSKWWQNRKKTS